MKIIKGVLLSILIFIVIIIGFAIYLSTQTEEVHKLITKEINDLQKGDFSFSKVTITNLRAFPSISIIINDLIISEPSDQGIDTIIKITKTYLEFDIRDFWRKDYTIKSISINNGFIKLKKYYDGSNSLKYFQSESESSNFNIKLKELNISKINILYSDIYNKNFAFVYVKKIKTIGKIDFSDLKINIKGNIFSHNIIFNNVSYFKNSRLNFNTILNYKKKELSIINCEFNLDNFIFISNGKIHFSNEQAYYDITIRTKKLDIKSLYYYLPAEYTKPLKINSVRGLISSDIFVKGNFKTDSIPDIKVFFTLQDADISFNNKTPISFLNFNIEGFYSNGPNRNLSSSYIKIEKATGIFNDIDLLGRVNLLNFINPVINYKIISTIPMSGLSSLFPNLGISDSKGIVQADVQGQFLINSIDSFHIIDYEMFDITGNIEFNSVHLKIKNNIIQQLNGRLFISDNIHFNNITLGLNNNRIKIDGNLLNSVSDLLLKDKTYLFSGKLFSNNLKLTDESYLGLIKTLNNNDTINDFPFNIKINLQVEFDTLSYKNFEAYKVNSEIIYRPKNIRFNRIGFIANNGELSGDGVIAQTSFNTFFVKAKSQFSNINITELFKSCNNFNQSTLTNKEISGMLSGNLLLSAEFNNDLTIQEEKLKCTADIEIKNGKLMNFEPANKLSKYIDIKELEEISFSTLSNVFEIKNREISFPEMNIFSSTYNIKLQGVHSFNNTFTYYIDLLLSEILSKKARTKNYASQNEVFKTKGQIKIPLILFGNVNNTQVKFNFKKALSSTKEDLNSEKEEIKKVLNSEFNTTQKNNNEISTKNRNTAFEIQWDEEEDSIHSKSSEESENNQKSSGFEIIWDENDDID